MKPETKWWDPLKGQEHERYLFSQMSLRDYKNDRERRGLQSLCPEAELMLQVERIESLVFKAVPRDAKMRDEEMRAGLNRLRRSLT